MAEIQIIDTYDDNLFTYASEVIPRKGESLTIQGNNNIFKVTSIEHYIRPHGGTGLLISPCIRVMVTTQPDGIDNEKTLHRF